MIGMFRCATEGEGNKSASAIGYPSANGCRWQRWEAVLPSHALHNVDEIVSGVDQCTVKIEDDRLGLLLHEVDVHISEGFAGPHHVIHRNVIGIEAIVASDRVVG